VIYCVPVFAIEECKGWKLSLFVKLHCTSEVLVQPECGQKRLSLVRCLCSHTYCTLVKASTRLPVIPAIASAKGVNRGRWF